MDAPALAPLLTVNNLPTTKQSTLDDWLPQNTDEILPLKEFKRQMEAVYIQKVLALSEGSVSECAKRLGLARGYLYQKLAELEIHPGK